MLDVVAPLFSNMITVHIIREGRATQVPFEPSVLETVRAGAADATVWIDLAAATEAERQQVLHEGFHFHPLAIEDCLQANQYPKIDEYEGYLFIIMHGVEKLSQGKCRTAELHFFLGKNYLVTYHDQPIQAVTAVTGRLTRSTSGSIRSADRLLHALADELVEQCHPALENLTREVEELEEQVFAPARVRGISRKFRSIKKEIVGLRQTALMQQEMISRLTRGEFDLIRPELTPYFRDVYDQLVHVGETTTRYSEELFLSLDVYLNKVSNETNEIIKLLTLVTAIATPATVIGTWYGMNFRNIPEINDSWGYPFILLLTIITTVGMVVWLKWKRWL